MDPIAPRFPNIQFSDKDRLADIIHNNSWRVPPHFPAELHDFLLQSTSQILLEGSSVTDSLLCQGNLTGTLSFKEAWNLLRSSQAGVNWLGPVWNKLMNPRLACFSWRLLHRKPPTDLWAKQRGWAIASRCYLCLSNEEDNLHLFFYCPLALQLWRWILSHGVNSPILPVCASYLVLSSPRA
eukprot:TRINITY_DN26813_c0_g1_i6.p2 TRINITY_DN26813_c0_g1~~TRINITY_DN26813_c0_g1_i6.p2  ORF type:complete len:182 (+),score=20.95 TRINITY_DN26813_c0_g1_i6:4651-5196(+)